MSLFLAKIFEKILNLFKNYHFLTFRGTISLDISNLYNTINTLLF